MSRVLGAVLLITGCCIGAMQIAAACIQEERTLHQLHKLLEWMICELRMRNTGLLPMFTQAGREFDRELGRFCKELTALIEKRETDLFALCVENALSQCSLGSTASDILRRLGNVLGQFDLEGQLQQLETLAGQCQLQWEEYRKDLPGRTRLIRTAGICGGLALAIVLI